MTECPICYEIMKPNNNNIKTECGHEFHSSCFLTNVAHNGFGCPYCRKELVMTPSISFSDEDEITIFDENEDEHEDVDEYLVAPQNYMIDKLQVQYSKRELLEVMYTYFSYDKNEESVEINFNFFNEFMKISDKFYALKEEEREISLMTMEDKNCNVRKEIKLIDNVEAIVNMRVY
jgi:hypothetical protein